MRLLVRSCREKNLFSSPLCTAATGTRRDQLDNLVRNKLFTHLFFMFAVSDEVFNVRRSSLIRVTFLNEGRLVAALPVAYLELLC